MQRAADISVEAHLSAMKQCRPGMMEYSLEAMLLKVFTERGSRSPAYPCIVAGGGRACVLHFKTMINRCKTENLF